MDFEGEKEEITVSREQAKKVFAQWWKDYNEDPSGFGDPDDDGTDSAETFFKYAHGFGAVVSRTVAVKEGE